MIPLTMRMVGYLLSFKGNRGKVKRNNIKRYTSIYWWKDKVNFGDALAPLLLEYYGNVVPLWSTPKSSQVLITGSNLDVIPFKNWKGIVAGAGCLHRKTNVDLSQSQVLGLRGKLTVANISGLKNKDYVLGDPGLLASELVSPDIGKYKLGVIPHWSDKELFDKELNKSIRYKYASPTLIDVAKPPLEVIKDIGSCDKIVSSSLHGLIVADSFGIPRRAEPFPGMKDNPYEGKTFKFEDYSSVIGLPIEFGKLQLVSREIIDTRKAELFDMMKELQRSLYATI